MIKKLFRNEFTKNVSVYISLKNEPSWNRKSCKKKMFYRWKDSFEDDISKILNIFVYMYKKLKSSKDRLIYGK